MSSKAEAAQKGSSPTSDVMEEETETEYSTTDEGEEASRRSAAFGNMRTRLRWDADQRALSLDVKQYVQNRRKLELRFKGRLNTASGDFQHSAQVQRVMSQNTPSLARIMAAEQGIPLEGEEAIDPHKFLPAGLQSLLFKDWTVAPGLRLATTGAAAAAAGAVVPAAGAAAAAAAEAGGGGSSSSSSSSALRYVVTFRKQPQVLWRRGVWDSWLEGKADLELDAHSQGAAAVGLRGAVRLKVLRLHVTQQQDLQLALGADYVRGHTSSNGSSGGKAAVDGSWTPYIKLSENSWAVRLSRNALAFTYDI